MKWIDANWDDGLESPWRASWGQVALIAIALVGSVFLFRLFPVLDRYPLYPFFGETSCDIFHRLNPDSPNCGLFPLEHMEEVTFARKTVNWLPTLMAVGLVALLIREHWAPLAGKVHRLYVIFLGLFSFLIGPGILVNLIVKPFWSRPRPVHTIEFGRYEPYIQPGTVVDICEHNCSFVSGDVAGIAWMLWVIPFLAAAWRMPVAIVLALLLIIVAVGRVAVGAHYPSDVVAGALMSFLVIALVSRLFMTAKGKLLLFRIAGTAR